MQTACADVLGRSVDLVRQVGHGVDRGGSELEGDPLGRQEGLVLSDQGGAGLAENSDEIVAGQVLELDPDRKPSLEFGHQVRRLAAVEGTGGDEEDVVGLDRTIFGGDGRPLDDRQEVALNALARDVGSATAAAVVAGDLVDLVDEDDPRLLGERYRGLVNLLGVDQVLGLMGEQDRPGLGHGHGPVPGRPGHDLLEHALEVHLHLFEVPRAHDRDRGHGAVREG